MVQLIQECSSIGRASVSKTEGWGFDSLHSCHEVNLKSIKIMSKFRPIKYIQEVKNEMDKVTWPSRRETTVTSIMVLIFVFIAAIFFLLSDRVLSWIVGLILGIGD